MQDRKDKGCYAAVLSSIENAAVFATRGAEFEELTY
jgi:hypothetical protein